ncbi:MAG: pyridoxal-phosphate dependent enzyme [Acidobacteriota bacterium]|nr:pyridoxal-phosphate dependent enzyme [Acidobacteriota bacterium]
MDERERSPDDIRTPDDSEPVADDDRPGGALGLVDGAGGAWQVLPSELDELRRAVADASRPLVERVEAYEDMLDSEVGDTDLTRARNIEREVGLRQIYLKFEGGNPTGTQKDRIAFAQALDSLRRGYEGMTVATCGNYGAAVALAAGLAGLRCVIYIPAGYHAKRAEEMARYGAEVVRVPGDYETAVQSSRERAARDEMYDANPGGDNTALQLRAYGEIAHEIYDQLRDAPAAVAVPVSNGTTLAGVHRGFVSLYRRGKTSRIPKLIAGSSFRQNPIVQAFVKGADHCEDLSPERIRETSVNEPLINWHSIDGDLALAAVRESGGWAGHASDRSLLVSARLIRAQQGLNVIPASAAGLHVLADRHAKEPLPGDRYVAILTGRRP